MSKKTEWQEAVENFAYHRTRTLDLLASLSGSDLLFTPGAGQSPLWRHFRHLGRVQENYTEALSTRKAQFTSRKASYIDGPDQANLLKYLRRIDEQMAEKLKASDPQMTIDWFGEAVTLEQHLIRLAEHEVLHHGQFVSYMASLKRDYPLSWSIWGLA